MCRLRQLCSLKAKVKLDLSFQSILISTFWRGRNKREELTGKNSKLWPSERGRASEADKPRWKFQLQCDSVGATGLFLKPLSFSFLIYRMEMMPSMFELCTGSRFSSLLSANRMPWVGTQVNRQLPGQVARR